MSIERDQVLELVRQELSKRLTHPALRLMHVPGDDARELDPETPRPCVIEPDRPCYQSGYCKRLGY